MTIRAVAYRATISAQMASLMSQDIGLDGSSLSLNTLTISNAALNFRFGWEGKLRTLESDAKAALENPQLMGTSISEVVEKLAADPSMRREFAAAYGGGPDARNIPDALVSFERTLVTPGSLAGRRCSRIVDGGTRRISAVQISGMCFLSPERKHRRQSFRATWNIPSIGVAQAGNSACAQPADRRHDATLFS
jgi:cytochrome c peroxidase